MADLIPWKFCPECNELILSDSPCPYCNAIAVKPAVKKEYIYGARDTATGKLVSDITNPRRKYWDKKGNAQKAIDYYNRGYANRKLKPFDNKGEHGLIELVTFELVEVKE
jgi:hypothetical protein